MKKKILSILLCGFVLISLTGCGNESKEETKNKITFTNNETLTFEEIYQKQEENYNSYETTYCEDTKIESSEGIISDISSTYSSRGTSLKGIVEEYVSVTIKDEHISIYMNISYDDKKELINSLKVGDRIKASNIYSSECKSRYSADDFKVDLPKNIDIIN